MAGNPTSSNTCKEPGGSAPTLRSARHGTGRGDGRTSALKAQLSARKPGTERRKRVADGEGGRGKGGRTAVAGRGVA